MSSDNSNNNNNNTINNRQNPPPGSPSVSVMSDIDQLVTLINNAVASRVPAAVDASLATMLDDRLTFANEAAIARANDVPTATADESTFPGAPMLGTVCSNCNYLIPAAQQPADRWYAIIVGRKVGWIQGWGFANELTGNLSGALKLHCANEQMACEMFHQRQMAGQVRVVPDTSFAPFDYTYQQGVLFS
ncbi:hypothetical protein PQX77_021215 [Marasmius sp. AFHP31]|nr:hypothetical protein PQX77_021215 [Marasmius sp. AFHP31]